MNALQCAQIRKCGEACVAQRGTRDRHEVPEYAAASFWCIFDFYSNGNCRLGRAFSGTCYLLRVTLHVATLL
jgi:hypothetical protein